MRFLILNTDYDDFLQPFYAAHPGLDEQPYDEQLRVRMDSLCGTADFYSANLIRLGHDAHDVIINAEVMQRQWAREHGIAISEGRSRWEFARDGGRIPGIRRTRSQAWMYEVLDAQIRFHRPDVIYCMALEAVDSAFLRSLDGHYRLAVGQHAAPLPDHDLSAYDLVLSSLPNQVAHFRAQGLKSEYLRLGFEPRILTRLTDQPKQHDVVFVGGLGEAHQAGTRVLEQLCARFAVKVWGYGVETLPRASAIRASYNGAIWGQEMYQALRDARIVLNRHIDVAGPYANNMRLYEATGAGSFLLTDMKSNLRDLFAVPDDVQAYADGDDCVRLVDDYLRNDAERERIAAAGQARTLQHHTWLDRMREMLDCVTPHV